MQYIDHWKSVFENLYEGVYFVDTNREITFWNKGAELITGYPASEVVGQHCYDNLLMHTNDDGMQLCVCGCPLLDSMRRNAMNSATVYVQHKGGYRVPLSVRTIPIVMDGEVLGAVEVFQVQREKLESTYNLEELKSLALTDQLTSLPNRRYTESFLKAKINDFETLGIQFGVLFMDIDHFKLLNDRYGHEAGDEVLRNLAKTFDHNLRSSDLVGRWGGEEFLGICLCSDALRLAQIADKTRVLTEKTITMACGQGLSVTISIGATMYQSGDTLQTLLKRADGLLYQSKTNGRNRVSVG